MVAKEKLPSPEGSPKKSTNTETRREEQKKKKTLYKPSRITVEYFSQNNDTSSAAQSCASPERRSGKESKRQSGIGSPRRSKPLSPRLSASRSKPLSPRPSASVKSPRSSMTIRSKLSNLSRKLRKDPLLSNDEMRIARMTSAKIEEFSEPQAYKPPVVVTSGSINDSLEKDRYEMADTKPVGTRGIAEIKDIAPDVGTSIDRCEGMSALGKQETGSFTDGTPTFGTDTYADDTFEDDTFSVETSNLKKSYMHYRFSKSSSGSSLGDGSIAIKQQVAWCCIFLSAAQFAVLTTQVLMCGIAKLNINPTIGPYPDAFSEWGGKNVYLLVEGQQYFRLITPTFLHVGYLHLLVNAFFQLETCAYLEREWGFNLWILIYLISGFGSCLAASAIDPNVIGVCSSGALMGLFGARIAQAIVWASFELRHEHLGQGALIFERLGGTVCSAAVVFFLTFLTYIDWSGHLGGLITGFLVGLVAFSHAVKSRSTRVTLRFVGTLGMLVGGIVLGVVLFYYAEADEDLADACDYFRNLYAEGYKCECQAFD